MTDPAPLYSDLAEGPPDGQAFWLRTSDGVRIRAAYWPGGDKGTVLLLPGRSEYIEKYGRAATDLAARGYATISVDWRGQGLADRALPDPMAGHVVDFAEYQLDMQAVLDLAHHLDVPRPWYLLSHSMGGSIALRTLNKPHPFKATVFSAPMWGIKMKPSLRPVAQVISNLSRFTGMSHRYAPSTSADSYVATAPFQDNVLTNDPDIFAWMKAQIAAHPPWHWAAPPLAGCTRH